MVAHIIQDTQILREKYGTSTTITQKFKLIINLRKKKRLCVNQHGENPAVPSTIHRKTELFAAHKFT